MKKNVAVVILAAGAGTRMKSALPKVLHPLSGKPLVKWVLSAVRGIKPDSVTLIVGHKSEEVRAALADDGVIFAEQKEQLGSGHALRQAARALGKFSGDIIVLCGDTPLIKTETLKALLSVHRRERNAATILSGMFDNPFGYGRIVRSSEGGVEGIVEEKDATPEQRLVREINSGIYCFQSPAIWQALAKVTANNSKGEYYLTDVIEILRQRGGRVHAFARVEPSEILGVNSRADLAAAEQHVRREVLARIMAEGVSVIDPAAVWVSAEARIGRDTVLYPGTIIEGSSVIGRGCRIGPLSHVIDSRIGNGVDLRQSVAREAVVGDGVKIGPFSHLRPGAVLKDNARVGNFSEVKKSVIGRGSKINHLSYIGDAAIGSNVNVGAGTITCNYDGAQKHRTVIGDGAFIGSNVNLVAPVTIGRNVLLAAGSTITDDVPSDMLAIARARQIHKDRKTKKP